MEFDQGRAVALLYGEDDLATKSHLPLGSAGKGHDAATSDEQ